MGKEETEEVMVPEKEEKGGGEEATSVERVFEGQRLPGWREQLTVRAFVVSFFLAVMFSVIVMKLNLTTGIIPSLNVAAGLLGFFFVKLWTKGLESTGLLRTPFTRQENTVIQTCVVAAYGLAFSVRTLGKYFAASFLWGFFQWFYTAGDGCGFASFPSLGLQAFEHKYPDLSI
ncbi:hypothetical protein BHM03_00039188 [Ensete ventricosum]|nr:hypothetical protein BHM03_00039188 [Ensete ventricosum]